MDLNIQNTDRIICLSGLHPESNEIIKIDSPITYRLLSGKRKTLGYLQVETDQKDKITASSKFEENEYKITLTDIWYRGSDTSITLKRKISAIVKSDHEHKSGRDGIQFELKLGLSAFQPDDPLRFYVPSLRYSNLKEYGSGKKTDCFMEDRMPCPSVGIYGEKDKNFYTLSRLSAPQECEEPMRRKGQCHYAHRTEVGSLGYSISRENSVEFEAFLPYYEGDRSVALNSSYDAASAYYPLDGSNFEIQLEYMVEIQRDVGFSQGMFHSFKSMSAYLSDERQFTEEFPFTMEESIAYRIASLGKCYKDLSENGGGFFFNFDPQNGYGSAPSGFGTSFNRIPEDTYTSILEYGFTGRQLNAALVMAQTKGGEWLSKGERVINFFINKCVLESGWMYTFYDLKRDKPFYSVGDSTAPKIHYVSTGLIKGNYLRTMCEVAYDLLLNYSFYLKIGKEKQRWFDKALAFADFLFKYQNTDGSWYRTYSPDGRSADATDESIKDVQLKSATAIPIVFLCELCKVLKQQDLCFQKYFDMAVKASEYAIDRFVTHDVYQGGTLDNPNITDKEASQYVMAAMVGMYEISGEKRYLNAGDRAARVFVTWNYIWDAPTRPDTFLDRKKFRTKGFGAINSVWGGGVVDIYSLFHVKELYSIGKYMNIPFYCEMALTIAKGTQQILSNGKDMMNFADSGMQPEGFGVCCQGCDEGMINKGDIWGSLGWIYTAGIFGIKRLIEIL